jgi:drug/metabolite transporter (DMT)-like permease
MRNVAAKWTGFLCLGVISAALILGEPLGLREVVTMVLTLGGVTLALQRACREDGRAGEAQQPRQMLCTLALSLASSCSHDGPGRVAKTNAMANLS